MCYNSKRRFPSVVFNPGQQNKLWFCLELYCIEKSKEHFTPVINFDFKNLFNQNSGEEHPPGKVKHALSILQDSSALTRHPLHGRIREAQHPSQCCDLSLSDWQLAGWQSKTKLRGWTRNSSCFASLWRTEVLLLWVPHILTCVWFWLKKPSAEEGRIWKKKKMKKKLRRGKKNSSGKMTLIGGFRFMNDGIETSPRLRLLMYNSRPPTNVQHL